MPQKKKKKLLVNLFFFYMCWKYLFESRDKILIFFYLFEIYNAKKRFILFSEFNFVSILNSLVNEYPMYLELFF